MRVAAAAAVGVTVFAPGPDRGGNRTAEPVSGEMVERSVPDGGGRNVVNVILVDFRGIDTMGEITVLAAAAIGSVALARAGRGPRRSRSGDGRRPPAGVTDPAADRGRRRPARSGVRRIVVVDVAVRIVFMAVMVGSIYLLFAGHNQPGGGFVGGHRGRRRRRAALRGGGHRRRPRSLSRAHPWTVLGTGLLISAITVAVPMLGGGAPLESATLGGRPAPARAT